MSVNIEPRFGSLSQDYVARDGVSSVVKHGAVGGRVFTSGVLVDRHIFFCESEHYCLVEGPAEGDGKPIAPDVPVEIRFPVGAPRSAGYYDVVFRVTKNNSSLVLDVEEWQKSARKVTALAPVAIE